MVHTILNTAEIKADLQEIRESILLIEWQPMQATVAWVHREKSKLLQIQQLRLEKDRTAAMQSIVEWFGQLDPVWNQVQQVVIIHNFPGFSLLPLNIGSSSLGDKLLELTNGSNNRETVLSDKVSGWQVQNYYRFPVEWMKMVEKNWQNASVFHYSSLFLETTSTDQENSHGSLRVVFFQSFFLVVLQKNGALQLMQTYEYQSPEDISFYLLSICKQFGLDQESVSLQLSGMIDPASALYAELTKYFLRMEWESSDLKNVPSDLPEHYFSPFLRMASCV